MFLGNCMPRGIYPAITGVFILSTIVSTTCKFVALIKHVSVYELRN